MTKDRLTRHIEDLKNTIQTLQETDSRVARYVSLQESLTRAEAVNEEIREAEEKIAAIAEPKERKPRTRKQAENGIYVQEVPTEQPKGEALAVEPE